ncbi:MAG: hypothetical protein J6R60_02235 [Clostridia bacterium]|nr:hypothetical protein [Clostridia bacterium]
MKWLGNFKFSSHDTDYQEVVKASSVVEYMQEGARLQLEECGPTEKDMKANNFAFVLSRTTAAIYQTLLVDDEISVETWASFSHGASCPRCTKMYKDGAIVAEMATVWTVVDINSRRIVRMGEELDKIAEEDELTLEFPPRFKIPPQIPMALIGEYNVGYSVCDKNVHMNNVRYVDMFTDYIPGSLKGQRIVSLDISYICEAPLNDTLRIYTSRDIGDGEFYFKAIRSDGKTCAEAHIITDRI